MSLLRVLTCAIGSLAVAAPVAAQIEYQSTDFFVQGNIVGAYADVDAQLVDFETQDASFHDSGAGGGVTLQAITDLNAIRIRPEIEAIWHNDFGTVRDTFRASFQDNWTLMANFWGDIRVHRDLYLYGGGGLGGAGTEVVFRSPLSSSRGTETQFAYQFGAGIVVPLSDDVEIDFGYRYVNAGSVTRTFDFDADVPEGGRFHGDLRMNLFFLAIRVQLN